MKKLILLVICIISVALVFTACSSNQVEEPKVSEEEVEVKVDGDNEINEGIFTGDKIYDFTLKNAKGEEISLSDLQGKVVFLNFWASWCPPCKSEMPHMQKVYDELKGEDFTMLTVNLTLLEKTGKEGSIAFLEENNYTFPTVFDEEGIVRDKFRIGSIPTTYIINKDGIIVSLIKAPLDEEGIKREIKKAMR